MKFLESLTSKFAASFILGLLLVVITVFSSRLYLEIFSTQKLSSFEKQSISEIGNRDTIGLSYKLSQLEAEYNSSCISAKYNDVTFFHGNSLNHKKCNPGFFKLRKSLIIGSSDIIKVDFLFLMPNELKVGFYMFLLLEVLILFAIGFAASKHERDRANSYLEFNTMAKRAAHDIRAPLTALNSLLFNFQNQNDPRSELLQSTISSMNSIAEDLLTFDKVSKQSSTKFPMSKLENLISQLISEKQILLANSSKKIDISFVRETETLIRNPIELYRVLSNILQNAIEAIENEGVIKIRISKESDKIKLEISDNGCGVPAKILARLGFEEITNKGNGNGFGFFYAKKTVESLNGRIRIDSKQGVGTNIQIELPV
jgi:signal transduction histidine kinase